MLCLYIRPSRFGRPRGAVLLLRNRPIRPRRPNKPSRPIRPNRPNYPNRPMGHGNRFDCAPTPDLVRQTALEPPTGQDTTIDRHYNFTKEHT